MKLSNLWSLGTAEFRTCRRSVGVWVIVAISSAVTLAHWATLAIHYANHALVSPVHGLIGPRYTFPEVGSTMLFMFSIGIIFLASDMRSRDIRSRISEVLDSQPMWDFEAVSGRLMGMVMFLAVSAVIFTLGILGFGMLADAYSFPIGTPIEPFSVLAFLVWDVVPNLTLWGSVAILLTQLIKIRLLAVLAALAVLGSVYFLDVVLPFSVSSVLSLHSGVDAFPSELAPTFVNWVVSANRALTFGIAAGCLALAAMLQSRNQSTKTFTQLLIFVIGTFVVTQGGISSLLIGNQIQNESTVNIWALAHKHKQSHSSTDIEQISGSIVIRPGRSINLNLTLTMNSSQDTEEDEWLFSLNPGYRLTDIAVNGTLSSDYTFEDGLLSVPRDESNKHPEVTIVAHGKPDERFAYLDSSLDWKELNAIGARRLYLLGQKSYIFHPNFVALMPGTSWIPTSGSAYGVDNLESRARDFYLLDVEVSVPKGWLVAGPGSRDVLDSSENSTYRLRTRDPVPELALVSSKFEQRSIVVGGVEYELLLNKNHTRNLHTLKEGGARFEEWLRGQSERLQDIGLEYPYSRLSLVEVPPSLRVYGGGWRMGSVYSAPGIQMIRESGFPVAPFSRRYSRTRVQFEGQETRFQNFMLDGIVAFFANDLHGGDPFIGIPKNFVDFQTAPTGNGATALRYVVNQLAMRVATTQSVGHFSVHTALMRGISAEPRSFRRSSSTFGNGSVYLRNWNKEYVDRSSVWELLEETPLSLMDYHADPENAFHALASKGQRVADSVVEKFGEEHVAGVLNQLVERFRGSSYTEEDFRRTALDVGVDIDAAIGEWLGESRMAGFVVDDLRSERLANDEEGRAVYQTSFSISNAESVPGVVRVSYQLKDRIGLFWDPIPLDPVHMQGNTTVRIAFQDRNPTQRVWLEPHLALNRGPIRLDFPVLVDAKPSDSPVLPYVTQMEWEPKDDGEVIVDDLDDGFTIENLPLDFGRSDVPKWIEYVAAVSSQEFDRGLPILGQRAQVYGFENRLNPLYALISQGQERERKNWWYRDSDPTSYGKYRRTYVGRSGGLDQAKPTFSTLVPTAGMWKLEYHLPTAMRSKIPFHAMRSLDDMAVEMSYDQLGIFTIHVSSAGLETDIDFDASTSLPGWNELGTFELTNTKVDVVLTEVSHGLAVADAIRWTPM